MPSSLRKALPTILDETYERALQGIPKEKRQHAHRIFQLLTGAIRPLRVEELAELIAIEFNEDEAGPNLKEGWRAENAEDAVLSACSTLIAVINNEGSKIVQFSHFSVKEYLTSDRLQTSEMENIRHYHISLDAVHTILARACLAVLVQLDEIVDKGRPEMISRAAFYAAQHWVDHAKYGDLKSRIQDTNEQSFSPIEERPTRPEETQLYHAALCGLSGLVDYFITHGENVNAECGNYGTLLHAASYKGNTGAARVLLAHGADANATNKFQRTPLCSAYHGGGHLDVMRLLLDNGAEVDVYYDSAGLLMHEASRHASGQAVVQLLLQYKADVNARNHENETPLHHASRHGGADVVQLLLEHKADVKARNHENETPLHHALRHGGTDVVQLLLECEADVNARNHENETPLHHALRNRGADVVRLLLEHKADVNARNHEDETPLHHALRYGRADDVRLLLEHKADVNARNCESETPLHYASMMGQASLAQLLLEHGAIVDAQDSHRYTPLFNASMHGHLDVVKILLQRGADVHKRGFEGLFTPFQVATLNRYHEIGHLLLKYGGEKE